MKRWYVALRRVGTQDVFAKLEVEHTVDNTLTKVSERPLDQATWFPGWYTGTPGQPPDESMLGHTDGFRLRALTLNGRWEPVHVLAETSANVYPVFPPHADNPAWERSTAVGTFEKEFPDLGFTLRVEQGEQVVMRRVDTQLLMRPVRPWEVPQAEAMDIWLQV